MEREEALWYKGGVGSLQITPLKPLSRNWNLGKPILGHFTPLSVIREGKCVKKVFFRFSVLFDTYFRTWELSKKWLTKKTDIKG